MRLRPTQLQVAAIVLAMAVRALATTVNITLSPCFFESGTFLCNFTILMMRKYINIIKRYTGELSAYIYLTLLVVILIILVLHIGGLQRGWVPNIQLSSAFLSSAIVAAITFILLKGQAKSQNTVQQNKRIFDNKLQVYESFLRDLQRVVANNMVTSEDEKALQFAVAALSIHTDSTDLLRISQCLKEIIQKIRTKDSVDNTMWHELMEIVFIFRRSLYTDSLKTLDSNIEHAIRNFSTIDCCDNKIHSLLEYIECNLSSYRYNTQISTYIEDKCFHVKIPIFKKIRKKYELDREIRLSLQINRVEEDKYYGRIGFYFPKDNGNILKQVYNNEHLWIRQMPDIIEDTNWRFGPDTVKMVVGLTIDGKDKLSILTIVYDMLNVINPLWVKEGMTILRKDKNGNIVKENPYNKE